MQLGSAGWNHPIHQGGASLCHPYGRLLDGLHQQRGRTRWGCHTCCHTCCQRRWFPTGWAAMAATRSWSPLATQANVNEIRNHDPGIVNTMSTVIKRHEICFQVRSWTYCLSILWVNFVWATWVEGIKTSDRTVIFGGHWNHFEFTSSGDDTEVTFQLHRAGDCRLELVAIAAATFGAPSCTCPSDNSWTSATASKERHRSVFETFWNPCWLMLIGGYRML